MFDMFDILKGKKTYITAFLTAGIVALEVAGVAIAPWVYPVCALVFGTSLRAGVGKAEKARDRK